MKKYVIVTLLGIFGGAISFLILAKVFFSHGNEQIQNPALSYPVAFTGGSVPTSVPDFTVAAEMSVHAVVHVKSMYKNQVYSDPIYSFFFGDMYQNQAPTVQTQGSGVIITSDGYIVTNNHVIQNAEYIEVVLNDKRTYTAKVIGVDPSTDIALLKIDEKNLPVISYGDSDALKVGEWVLAVGNPFNLTSTVTAGIVSAKARNINILSQYSIESFIQTDAAVNPGNSGGALINNQGLLVGINTAIASQTGSYVGYSFAIPVNIVKKIVTDLIEFGEVKRAYLGVSIQSLDPRLAVDKGIDLKSGVYVEEVYQDGAAKDGGAQPGDVIIAMNDFPIADIPMLHEQLSKYRPGDVIKVKVNRAGKEMVLNFTLKNKLNQANLDKAEVASVMGAKMSEVSLDEKQKLRIQSGVKIVEVKQGRFQSVGIKPTFIITHINKTPVNSVEDAVYFLQKAKGTVFIEGVYPNGMYAYYSFGL